jgi:hypothetical protein
VSVSEGGALLVCLFHEQAEGACFPLPRCGRPEHWPDCTHDEIKALVDEGFREQDDS